jgi:ABC-type branched-subunit amino acid transport system substrate-binding protein
MDQKIDEGNQDPYGALRRRLREQGLIQRINSVARRVQGQLPEEIRWKIPLWILSWLSLITFRIVVTGRVPVLSGPYWWIMRQRYLAPKMSNTFDRFAGRLIDGEWQNEAPEEVARLLVNAFLEDLRRAYRLRPWHLFRKRRMTYPVLLLDNITVHNGGFDLLILINQVRNQVGVFDPLLVISISRAVPPDVHAVPPDTGAIPDRPRCDAEKAFSAFNAWQDRLLDDRRARRDTTWYLPLHLPSTPIPAHSGYECIGRECQPPFFTSRWFRVVVATAVLVGAGVIAGTTYHARCNTVDANLSWTGSECIGVSDGSTDLFQPSNKTIRQVEQTVLAQNERAAAMHAAAPKRPYITIVELQAITSSNNTASGLTAERESLEGVAVAQQRQLKKSGSSDPIVRALIGNAGNGMRQGATVAQQLGALARRDPSLVGVVGLDLSSQQTHATLTALAKAGLPMVAEALSEDSLADNNPLYFQVAPQNRREAAMVAAFALQHLAQDPTLTKSVRVYYSDDATDTYSANLRQDVMHAFASQGFHTSAIAFTPSPAPGLTTHQQTGDTLIGNAVAAGRDTCGYHGFVFFAGRGVPDYGDFLSGAEQCTNTAVFIGDDDVSRYVANSTLRGQYSVPYYYVSFAPEPMASPPGAEQDFYTGLKSLFRFEQQPRQGRSLDGHAALSYDAALVVITATEYLREGPTVLPVTPGNVWREITDIHSAQTSQPDADKAIDGATGTIDNNGDITRHVPLNKLIAILQVRNGKVDPNVQGLCGTVAGRVPSAWCPPGS